MIEMKKPLTAVFLFSKNDEEPFFFGKIYALLREKMRKNGEKISLVKPFDFFRQSF